MARPRRIAAGDLNKPVAWRSYDAAATDAARDPSGQPINQYVEMGTHWASIEPLKGAALINATAILAARWSELVMHAGVGPVKALDLLVYNGRAFVVQSVLDDFERGAYLRIQATEAPAG